MPPPHSKALYCSDVFLMHLQGCYLIFLVTVCETLEIFALCVGPAVLRIRTYISTFYYISIPPFLHGTHGGLHSFPAALLSSQQPCEVA